MTPKKFLNTLANSNVDVIKEFFELLSNLNISYCVIGGLAVNAYAEPVVSMDSDLVLTLADIMRLVETHSHLYDLLPHEVKEMF